MTEESKEVPTVESMTEPTFQVEFPTERIPWIPFDYKAALSFVAKHKLDVGSVFLLTDNDVIIKATLKKDNLRHIAVIHWGTQRDVVA